MRLELIRILQSCLTAYNQLTLGRLFNIKEFRLNQRFTNSVFRNSFLSFFVNKANSFHANVARYNHNFLQASSR